MVNDPKKPGGGRTDTTPGKAKDLIGRGHNVSVRSVQRAGLTRPGATSAATPSAQRIGDTQRLKELAAVDDAESYVLKPAEVVLMKELGKQRPEVVKARLKALGPSEIGTLAALATRALGEENTIARLLRQLAQAPKKDDSWM